MRKNWLIPFSAFMIAFSSCTKDDVVSDIRNGQDETEINDDKLIEVSFRAIAPHNGNDSRTSLEQNNEVYWNNGDAIVVTGDYAYDEEDMFKFTTVIKDGKSPEAYFKGRVTQDLTFVYAFYPYSSFISRNYAGSHFSIPLKQEAVSGTFSQNINPSWAYSDRLGGDLQFHNIGALIKFSLKNVPQDISSIVLTDNNSDIALTGEMCINLEDKENPVLTFSPSWNSIKSNSAILEGTFEDNKPYYFVVAPNEGALKDGFTFTLTKNDGRVYKMEANGIQNLHSGMIANLGEITVPDDTEFTNNIVDLEFISDVENSLAQSGYNLEWTKNADGTVSLTEENLVKMAEVPYLSFENLNIMSVPYLNYFTGITSLSIRDSYLETMDLNSLQKLERLDISNCALTGLNIGKLYNLQSLNCQYNNITTLDVANLTNLYSLSCMSNKLVELNVEGLVNLVSLECRGNEISELKVGNLTKLTDLSCSGNKISSLDVSGLTNLIYFDCASNNISSLDVSGLTNLESLNVVGNKLENIDVSKLTKLVDLRVSENNISTIDVSQLTNVKELYISKTNIQEIDLSTMTSLQRFESFGTKLKTLDLSNNKELTMLECTSGDLEELDLSNNTLLKEIQCSNNKLKKLDIRHNQKISNLNCSYQNLEDESVKMKLYITPEQESIWQSIEASHQYTVEVIIEALGN